MVTVGNSLIRIGIFYDGNYFFHVSNYYAYYHQRKARIDISGLHNFIRRRVSEAEGTDEKYCQIVDAHYFRGRLRAREAEERDSLLKDRIFDDILMREGVTSHYLPLDARGEKGIDVWLALEAYELAIYKRFDVSVILAGDGDFLPLVRKLNTTGTRVMLVCWDFKFQDQDGRERETKTSQALLEEVTYPVLMQQVIDDRSLKNDALVNALFVQRPDPNSSMQESRFAENSLPAMDFSAAANPGSIEKTGSIRTLQNGYGFIAPDEGGENIFFYWADVLNMEFADVDIGMRVDFELGKNERGLCARKVHIVDI